MAFQRASKYDANREELIEEILKRLARGEYLADICRSRGMPSTSTVAVWEEKVQGLTGRILRAREDGEVQRAQDIGRVSRGEEGYSSGDVQRDKLIVDTELKLLAKFNPRKWGDKSFLEHSGSITLMFADLTDDELVDRILDLQATGRFKPPGGVVLEKVEPKALPPPEPAEDDYSDIA